VTAPLRIGLLGYGTVGRAFVRLLQEESPRLALQAGVRLTLAAVASRDLPRKLPAADLPSGTRVGDDLLAVATAPDVDVVIELLGGVEPAGTAVAAALDSGRGVVTANKLLLATRGTDLSTRARENGVPLAFEAAVAGGIPILRAVREGFTGDGIDAVSGILNGTSNFVLSEMARTARPYGEILAEAQALGYAEADPSADVEGADAACKLALLARMAFGQDVPLDSVRTEGIARLRPVDFEYARMLGRTPRQLGFARRLPDGRLLLSVRTHLVSNGSILARVDGPFNAVQVSTVHGGDFVFTGRGAGGDPTATAVLADVVEIARSGHRAGVPAFGWNGRIPFAPAGPADLVAPFYLRFVVADRPGILADLTTALARHDVNVDAVLQVPGRDKGALPFVVTLEPVDEARLGRALADLASFPFHREAPLVLPMTP
jgi:homoserine dehydrogenase